MPRRRGLAALGTGLAAGLRVYGESVSAQGLKQHALDEQERLQQSGRDDQETQQLLQQVLEGKISPEQARAAAKVRGINLKPQDLAGVEPSMASRMGDITGGITKASTFQETPTEEAIKGGMRAKRVPVRADFQQQPAVPAGPANLESTPFQTDRSPELKGALTVRDQKLDQFAPTRVGVYNPAAGAKEDQFVPSRPDQLSNRAFQTEPTGQQKGQQELASTLANELSPERSAAMVTQQNTVEEGTRAGKVKTTSQESSARVAAEINTKTLMAKQLAAQAYNEAAARNQANLATLGQEIDIKEFHAGLNKALTSSTQALGVVAEGEALMKAAAAELKRSPAGVPLIGNFASYAMDKIPASLLVGMPATKQYVNWVATKLPVLARIGLEVGNLNQFEQANSKLIVPDLTDLAQGTGDAKFSRFRAFAASTPEIFRALNGPNAVRDPNQRLQLLNRILDEAEKSMADTVLVDVP